MWMKSLWLINTSLQRTSSFFHLCLPLRNQRIIVFSLVFGKLRFSLQGIKHMWVCLLASHFLGESTLPWPLLSGHMCLFTQSTRVNTGHRRKPVITGSWIKGTDPRTFLPQNVKLVTWRKWPVGSNFTENGVPISNPLPLRSSWNPGSVSRFSVNRSSLYSVSYKSPSPGAL